MTPEEMESSARAASMARAQSPGPLTCQIDGTWSVDDPFHHDPYQACMDFRHRNVVGDDQPWTHWQLIDGPLIGPKPPIPPLPVGLRDWQIRVTAGTIPAGSAIPIIPPPLPGTLPRVWAVRTQVNTGTYDTGNVDVDGNPIMATNPPAMDGRQAGWNGWTFAILIYTDDIVPTAAAFATRVTLVGSFTLDSLYMGTVDPNSPFAATNFHRFQFWVDADGYYIANDPNHTNPDGQLSNKVIASMDDMGNFIPVVTEPLGVGFDATNGWIISGYFTSDGNGIVGSGSQGLNGSWYSYADQIFDEFGNAFSQDSAANIDKNTYSYTYYASTAVLMIEGFYDPAQVPAGTPTSTT